MTPNLKNNNSDDTQERKANKRYQKQQTPATHCHCRPRHTSRPPRSPSHHPFGLCPPLFSCHLPSIPYSSRFSASPQHATSAHTHAVFFHCRYTPIKLLSVPARPTKPSSSLTQLRADRGTVRSQRSEVSCSRLAVRSLQARAHTPPLALPARPNSIRPTGILENEKKNKRETHMAILLLSTTPSPSLRSTLASRWRSW